MLGPVRVLPSLSPTDAAWVAGLLEGEGTFPLRSTGGGTIRVQMTDEDVIERLYQVLTIGNRGTYIPRNPHHKQSWMLTVARREYIFWLIEQIGPFMGDRRRAAIYLLINNFTAPGKMPAMIDIPLLPDPLSTAWLAGLIEGEGSIAPHEMSITSIDHDILQRVRDITRCGQIYPVRKQQPHHRNAFVWKLTSHEHIDYVLCLIKPWMLRRRSTAIDTVFSTRQRSKAMKLARIQAGRRYPLASKGD
jgi:LAGLIDADG-like domain